MMCCCPCCFAGFLIAHEEQKYLYNINKVLDNYETYQCVNTPLINHDPAEYKDVEYEKHYLKMKNMHSQDIKMKLTIKN